MTKWMIIAGLIGLLIGLISGLGERDAPDDLIKEYERLI